MQGEGVNTVRLRDLPHQTTMSMTSNYERMIPVSYSTPRKVLVTFPVPRKKSVTSPHPRKMSITGQKQRKQSVVRGVPQGPPLPSHRSSKQTTNKNLPKYNTSLPEKVFDKLDLLDLRESDKGQILTKTEAKSTPNEKNKSEEEFEQIQPSLLFRQSVPEDFSLKLQVRPLPCIL